MLTPKGLNISDIAEKLQHISLPEVCSSFTSGAWGPIFPDSQPFGLSRQSAVWEDMYEAFQCLACTQPSVMLELPREPHLLSLWHSFHECLPISKRDRSRVAGTGSLIQLN